MINKAVWPIFKNSCGNSEGFILASSTLLFYNSCTDKESHVLLEIIVHNPVVIDISTLSIPSAIHEAVPSVPSFCLEQRTHIRIFLIFPLSIYLKTRR